MKLETIGIVLISLVLCTAHADTKSRDQKRDPASSSSGTRVIKQNTNSNRVSRTKTKTHKRINNKHKARMGVKRMLRLKGHTLSGSMVRFNKLPKKAQQKIKSTFNQQLKGHKKLFIKNGNTRQKYIGSFTSETRGGTALDCEFNEFAIGCWTDNGNFTGCYAVGDDGEWNCDWNEPQGTSDD